MLSIEERTDLIREARERMRLGEIPAVIGLLAPLPAEELLEEPELGMRYALALNSYGQAELARGLYAQIRERALARSDERLLLRLALSESGGYILAAELDRATEVALPAVAPAAAAGDHYVLGALANGLGVVATIRCQWDQALAHYSRAIAAFQQLGDPRLISSTHHNLGMTYRQLGFFSAAETHFEHALAFRRPGEPVTAASTEMERALLLAQRGDLQFAEATARRAHAVIEKAGNPRQLGEVLRVLGIVVAPRDEAEAGALLEESLRIAVRTETRLLEAEVREELAVLAYRAGDAFSGAEFLAGSVALYEGMGASARAENARGRLAPYASMSRTLDSN